MTKFTPNNPKKIQFKFVFTDAATSIINAENYTDAAILAMSARIRAAKSKKLVGAWSKDEQGSWNHVIQKDLKLDF